MKTSLPDGGGPASAGAVPGHAGLPQLPYRGGPASADERASALPSRARRQAGWLLLPHGGGPASAGERASALPSRQRRKTGLLLWVTATAALLAAADLRSDWNLRDHIPLSEITVQSHRGAGVLMPENSIDAFEVAWSLGTVPEGDLRTTRDGVIVAFHDENFKRILPNASAEMQKRGIKDLDWAEVSKLDIGGWKGPKFAGQRVPRMTDVYDILRRHPRRRLYIDIKNVDLGQLAREAGAAGVLPRLILASTDYAIIRRWKELAPQSSTLHWMGGAEDVLAGRIAELRKTRFASITQLQIHVRVKDGVMSPSSEFLMKTGAELRTHGILFQTLPWGSDDPALFRRLMDLGSASFATDYPDVAMKTIGEYYERR